MYLPKQQGEQNAGRNMSEFCRIVKKAPGHREQGEAEPWEFWRRPWKVGRTLKNHRRISGV
jgi:alkyl hydroperoxide reductase subunit AhpC